MDPDYIPRFPSQTATLKDGRLVRLRLLSPDDADALADFYASMDRETWRFYCPPRLTREDAVERAKWGVSPRHVCLVGVNEPTRRIVGYNWYQWKDAASRASVFGICIRKSHRGVGLGRALIKRLLEIARELAPELGPPVMSLTVQLANPRAVALYTKMGFQIVRQQMRPQVGDFAPEPEYYMEQTMR